MIHSMLATHAENRREKIAVVHGSRRVTYGELSAQVERVAESLVRSGVQKGERVAIMSENSPEYISAYLGCHLAGAIAVDVNFQFSAREAQKILNHSQAAALIAERKYLDKISACFGALPGLRLVIGIDRRAKRPPAPPALSPSSSGPCRYLSFDEAVEQREAGEPLPAVQPDDIASVIYTSGTTGDPKGVMLTHDNFTANARSIISYLELTDQDSVMVVLPFCYSYGKSLLTTHLSIGGTLVLENSFMYPNVVLQKMIDEAVTGFAGVPSTFAILLNRSNIATQRFPKLRYVTQAGGALSPVHARRLLDVFCNSRFYIMYGQTEATARLTYLAPEELKRKSGSIGRAIPGVSIELLKKGDVPARAGEEGEIVATGANVMAGYWNNPEATARVLRNGKLYTGDMATMDEEGYLHIVGRRSDMIKSGAHRISPKEIEEAVLELPEVHETAVVGVPDDILGQSIRAYIVLKEGMTVDANRVLLHCQARLASFKVPQDVVFAAELPKTMSGKIKRHELNQQPAADALLMSEEVGKP
jgi:long-chain acyl-CoA synthetase